MNIVDRSKKLNIRRRKVKKLKWGVAGCGRYSEFSFIPNLLLLKRSRLISVYSSKLSRAKEIKNKFSAENAFDNYDDFIKSDIDVIYIGSANSDHYTQVIKAAEAGKHILCEKPLALSAKEAEEMIEVCEKNNVLLTINYVNRYDAMVKKAKELIDKNMLGKIVSISANLNIDYPPDNNFRFKKKLSGGGALRDLGTHVIDLLRYFAGDITDVCGFVDNVVYQSEVDDFANGIVKFQKSGYGYFTCSYSTQDAFNRIEVLGYKGSMCIEKMLGVKNQSCKLTISLKGESVRAFRKKSNRQLLLLKDVQKHFLANKQPKINGNDGLVNMKLMEELEAKC